MDTFNTFDTHDFSGYVFAWGRMLAPACVAGRLRHELLEQDFVLKTPVNQHFLLY